MEARSPPPRGATRSLFFGVWRGRALAGEDVAARLPDAPSLPPEMSPLPLFLEPWRGADDPPVDSGVPVLLSRRRLSKFVL